MKTSGASKKYIYEIFIFELCKCSVDLLVLCVVLSLIKYIDVLVVQNFYNLLDLGQTSPENKYTIHYRIQINKESKNFLVTSNSQEP